MATALSVPKLGLTMTKGVVTQWLFEDGAQVTRGDVIYILTTDKTDAEIEADIDGLLCRLVPVGTTLKPGETAGWLLAAGEAPPAVAAPPVTPAPVAAPTAVSPAAVGASPGSAVVAADGGRLFVSPNARRVAALLGVDVASVQGTGPGGRIVSEDIEAAAVAGTSASRVQHLPSGPVSPLASRLAEQLGVPLDALRGTGPGRRIRLDDVVAAARSTVNSSAVTTAVAPSGPLPGEVVSHSGMRRAIAARMHASLQEMAQLTLVREVEVDALVALRTQLKDGWVARGWAVPSYTDLVLKAVALVLREHPRLNATFEAERLVLHEQCDLGMAVSLDDGLVVPVVRSVDELPLRMIADVTTSLAARARAGSLGIDDYADPTFTVTALGAAGIDSFTPVINPPNVAILGVGRIKDGVGWKGDTPVRLQVMTFSLTIDHRIVDGAPGAAFLATLADVLAHPLALVG